MTYVPINSTEIIAVKKRCRKGLSPPLSSGVTDSSVNTKVETGSEGRGGGAGAGGTQRLCHKAAPPKSPSAWPTHARSGRLSSSRPAAQHVGCSARLAPRPSHVRFVAKASAQLPERTGGGAGGSPGNARELPRWSPGAASASQTSTRPAAPHGAGAGHPRPGHRWEERAQGRWGPSRGGDRRVDCHGDTFWWAQGTRCGTTPRCQ